jgi:hypothetical protein
MVTIQLIVLIAKDQRPAARIFIVGASIRSRKSTKVVRRSGGTSESHEGDESTVEHHDSFCQGKTPEERRVRLSCG